MDFDNITTAQCLVVQRNPGTGQTAPLLSQTTPKPCGSLDGNLVELVVTPTYASVEVDGTWQYQAFARLSDGTTQDVTVLADWRTSAAAVATIEDGLITGVAAGATTVTASYQGQEAVGNLTVNTGCTSANLDIMLALDRSGTMNITDSTGRTRIAAVKDAVEQMIDNLRPNRDQLGIVTYAGKVWFSEAGAVIKTESDAVLKSVLTDDKVDLKATLSDYEVPSGCMASRYFSPCATGIGGGLQSALAELNSTRSRAGAIKVLVLMTDGAENINNPIPATIADQAKAQGVVVVTVGVDVPYNFRAALQGLASSGKGYLLSTGSEVARIFSGLAYRICSDNVDPCAALAILTTALDYATAGEAWSQTLTATGGSNYAWTLGGSTPEWLTINASTGVLSATVPVEGNFQVTVTVTSGACSESRTFGLTVSAADAENPFENFTFVNSCDDPPQNYAGQWDDFGGGQTSPPETDDFHWILTIETDTPQTLSKILVENTGPTGVNLTGQYWCTTDDYSPAIAPKTSGVKHYPLVVLDAGSQQLNSAYNQNISIEPGTTVLHLFGQMVVPPSTEAASEYGHWKVSITAVGYEPVTRVIPNTCEVACASRNFAKTMFTASGEWDLTDFFNYQFGTGAGGFLRWRLVHNYFFYYPNCESGYTTIYAKVIAGHGVGGAVSVEGVANAGGVPDSDGIFNPSDNGTPLLTTPYTTSGTGYSLELDGKVVKFNIVVPECTDYTNRYPNVHVALQIGCVDSEGNITWPDSIS